MRIATLLLLSCACGLASAQTVTDVARRGDNYVMRIDGAKYVAITEARLGQLLDLVEKHAQLQKDMDKLKEALDKQGALADAYQQLQKDYAALSQKHRALVDDAVKLGDQYSDAARKLVALNQDYRGLVADYDALARKYRDIAMSTAPREALDVGLGIVHAAAENRVVGLAGIGTRVLGVGLRSWVFGGQGTYGLMMGVSF